MDTPEGALEAEVDLDAEAIRQQQRRRRSDYGRQTARAAKAGYDDGQSPEEDLEADERSRLIERQQREESERASSETVGEFAHLPWHKRPSIFWVLIPFFLMATAFGGILAPKINLILELVCREYFAERAMKEPGFTFIPVDFQGGGNDQCRIPEVQSRVSVFTLWGSLIAGLLTAVTAPKLGALSDRYGRKPVLVATSLGTILGEIITICAATYPDTFPVNMLLLSYALDGLTGSFILAMAIANAYAADCVPPSRRNVAFGYFHGCLFTGIAIGPIIGGAIVKATGKIVVVFYILTAVHVFFIFFITFFVPESLSKKRQLAAREKQEQELEQLGPKNDWINAIRSLNFLGHLKVLWPTGPGSSPALRRNLFFLASIDTIVFGVAMGSIMLIIMYSNFKFGWQTYESGMFMSIVNSVRVFALLVILPSLTRWVRGKPAATAKQKATGCDTLDVSIIRAAVLIDSIGYVGYTLAQSSNVMIISGAVAALGGIASPTLQSSLTKHVPADKTGQILGATTLLHALARVVAPTTFSAIYAATVKNYPQTVFLCLASTFGLAFLISWTLKTGGTYTSICTAMLESSANMSIVYFDEDKAEEAALDPNSLHHQQNHSEGLPIVGPAIAAFTSFAVYMGLSTAD